MQNVANAPKLMQYAAKRPQKMQDAAKRPQIAAERSFSREGAHSLEKKWAHSLENEHHIAAERSKMDPKLINA